MNYFHQKILDARTKENNRKWLAKKMSALWLVICFVVFLIAVLVSSGSNDAVPSQNVTTSKKQANPTDASAEDRTKNAICYFFENRNIKIKRFMYQPLVEKEPGLYGGMERWWITFENGEYTAVWVKNDKITYFYDGIHYNDIPLY